MSLGWAVIRHNKASNTLVLGFTNLVNSQVSNTLQHFDVLGICISISVHLYKSRCACAYISAWASVLLVRIRWQYQSQWSGTATVQSRFFVHMLCVCMEAEHYIAGDRFFCVRLLSMGNFSLDVQGILMTSRYGEKLLVDYSTWKKL